MSSGAVDTNVRTIEKYVGKNGFEIEIDLARDQDLTEFAKATLLRGYQTDQEKSPQYAFARASCAFADDPQHAQRLYNYCSSRWFGYATPIISNGGTDKGLPISCFLNYVGDSRWWLGDNYMENIFLSTNGGGIGGYWGHIRSKGTATTSGNVTTGIIPFLKTIDSFVLAYKQGIFRRGSYAAYLDISHPEVEEFINMRRPAGGGDVNRRCLNLHHAINITDEFMQAAKDGKSWDLIDPHTNEVKKTVDARHLYCKILKMRVETGEPYIHYIDTTNRHLPEPLKHLGLKVNQSNLCSEITLPTSLDRTAVCCLSSVNVEKFDEWKDDPLFIEDLLRMLDNALQHFIDTAPDEMSKAVFSAERERSIGLGQLGFHYYLQSKNIPFEGAVAVGQSRRISKHIYDKALEANLKLGEERGEAPDMKGTGQRFAHMIAIAPTASNSIICGTTPSIEPLAGNAYTHKTQAGSFYVRNKYLREVLKKYDKDTKEVWKNIYDNDGSVQQFEWLSKDDRDVFKTSIEIDQHWIVEHAAIRQPFICQAQSVNLFFHSNVHIDYLTAVHFKAWRKGLKTLYYLRSQAPGRTGKIGTVEESKLGNEIPDDDDCISCQG